MLQSDPSLRRATGHWKLDETELRWMRNELRRVATRLSDQKTDRKALATMLMEVATRLETGSSVTGLLEDLTGKLKE